MKTTTNENRRKACVLAVLMASSPAAHADTLQSFSARAEPEADVARGADGYRAAGFLLRPEVAVSAFHDSNVFAERDDEVDDAILLVEPDLSLVSEWARHEMKLGLGAALGRYDDNRDENYDDYSGSLSGRFDISDSTNVFGGAGYSFTHEDRGSPEDDLSGDEPTTYGSGTAHAGVAHAWKQFALRAGGTFERLDFDDVAPLNNDDRDRDMRGFGARLIYSPHSRYSVYVQGVSDVRDYQRAADDYGYRRDSDGYIADLGVTARISNRLKGSIYGGWLSQDYEDARFSHVGVPDFGAELNWRAAPRTTWSAELDRSLEETTIPGASSYLYTSLGAQVEHLLGPRLSLNAALSVARADYQDIKRQDEYSGGALGMRYYLSPRWYLGAEYRIKMRDSSARESVDNLANRQDLDDYARNQFLVTLGTLLYPVRKPAYWDMPSGELLSSERIDASGFYAGAQAGHGTLNAQTDGVRGGSGIDKGEFSDADVNRGLFAGYGRYFNRWYLGVELEADTGDADIAHRKSKTQSRALVMDRKDSAGAALRAGYQLPGGSLLYGRAGLVETDFDTFFAVNDAPQNAFDDSFDKRGTRYGVGADIPAWRALFLRLDYSYSEYDDFSADIVTEVEKFSPREDLFRIGAGWNFGDTARVQPRVAVRRGGPYAGAHVAHGALQTDLTGTHTESDGSGGMLSSDFFGDYGDDSGATGGLFAGYGLLHRHWYLALEGEVEDSSLDWKHVRRPNGRNFSVEKQGSKGLSLLAGYELANGALLYARGGMVHSDFNTAWSKGENRSNDIDRDDRVAGKRYGVGAELPLGRSLFLRLDYTVTDYDSYALQTAHASSDAMDFENSETLFRLGLGSRF